MSETNVEPTNCLYIIEQLKKIHEENTVLREALGQIAYAKLTAYHCEDIAKRALQKVGGE